VTDPVVASFSDRIVVGGRPFALVTVRRSDVAVYRGEGAYLRLGLATVDEVALQRRMLDEGYPVAEILDVGEHTGSPYFVEASLGEDTWGDAHEERIRPGVAVGAEEFWEFGDVMLRWARAQVQGVRRPWQVTDLAGLLGVDRAVDHLPGLAVSIRAAFGQAATLLHDLPGALQHDDLHPYNACPGGVIDLEGVGWAVAGYDVVTAVLEPSLAQARWVDDVLALAWFAEEQVREFLERLDDDFVRASARAPSTYLDAYLICRAISRCSHVHPDERVWNGRRDMLARLLTFFLDAGRLPLGMTR
jgi:hypothetical protein